MIRYSLPAVVDFLRTHDTHLSRFYARAIVKWGRKWCFDELTKDDLYTLTDDYHARLIASEVVGVMDRELF